MKNGVAGRRVAVANRTAPTTELQPQLVNNAHSHGLGNFSLCYGAGFQENESVAALARHRLSGIKKSGAVAPANTGTFSNPEVVFLALAKS